LCCHREKATAVLARSVTATVNLIDEPNEASQ
jgi:hypothetical protein